MGVTGGRYGAAMALTPPSTLSPSKMSTFTDCALAFRYSAIDLVPEPPSVAATRGSLVHRALEHLFDRPAPDRTPENAASDLARAFAEYQLAPDYVGLELDEPAARTFFDEAERLVARYFEVEDPKEVRPIGLELKLEADLDGIRIRGIIDRLELDADGGLVVTDYKTGRAPPDARTQRRLGGVGFYALLCEECFGVLPSRVQLVYLGDRTVITTQPTAQSTAGLRRRINALWQAVDTACRREDFRPRPSALCGWCGFRDLCPAQGGDPARLPEVLEARRAIADDVARRVAERVALARSTTTTSS